MQLGAKQSQLTATTRTCGDASIIDSRRPVLHSQHIPTFCSAKRQHSSSRSTRESSSFTHWQHYDDCRCNSLEGVHSTCFTCSHRECRARSCHCAHLRPLQRLRYRLFGGGDSNSGHPARLASILPLYYVFASKLCAKPVRVCIYFKAYKITLSNTSGRHLYQ